MAASHDSSLVSLETTIALTTLSKSSIYELMGRGDFPAPVKLSARRVAWRMQDLSRWLDSRVASEIKAIRPRVVPADAQSLHAVKATLAVIEEHGGATAEERAFFEMIVAKLSESAQ